MTEAELIAWVEIPGNCMWAFRVSDKFGPMGLTGLLSIEVEPVRARIVDFVLSCRVMGRKVEESMLAIAIRHVRSLGVPNLEAKYLPTPKNKPCLEVLKRSGLRYEPDSDIFHWNTAVDYPHPQQVVLESLAS